MPNKSHLTAIARRTLPLPTRWLMANDLIRGRVLDYGCGRCAPLNPMEWDSYDPNFYTAGPTPSYDTIICIYVMCVLAPRERKDVLRKIHALLKSDGIAYIAVNKRRPKKGWGQSSRGTYQGRGMNLRLDEVYSNSNFRILKMTPDTIL